VKSLGNGGLTITEEKAADVQFLLESIFKKYGYDFRSYGRSSIARRVELFLIKSGCTSIRELTAKVLKDEDVFGELAQYFSIAVTEMFRDPFVYKGLREEVIPFLRTFHFPRIWHAGCATGEEAYSFAIVLKEENILERSTIFATDFNDAVLAAGRKGIYSLEKIQQYTRNYQQAGGRSSFSDYYHASYGMAVMDNSLRNKITFANHNLVSDGVFGEVNLIFCRNVLIYFDKDLKDRVVNLFARSLTNKGFLCIGTKSSLKGSKAGKNFKLVNKALHVYQKSTESKVDLFQTEDCAAVQSRAGSPNERYKAIVIGASSGGLHSLALVLAHLSESFPWPILVVQHLHQTDGGHHASRLNALVSVDVKEALDGEKVQAGRVYVAPADYHMSVKADGVLSLSRSQKVKWSRPSIDVLFQSAAEVYGKQVIGIILSGANDDGTKGLSQIKARGGIVIAQDPDTAESREMPSAAIDRVKVDGSFSPAKIGALLSRYGDETTKIFHE
jgi:chemotaxis protein methyltransferase CheR